MAEPDVAGFGERAGQVGPGRARLVAEGEPQVAGDAGGIRDLGEADIGDVGPGAKRIERGELLSRAELAEARSRLAGAVGVLVDRIRGAEAIGQVGAAAGPGDTPFGAVEQAVDIVLAGAAERTDRARRRRRRRQW